MDAAVGPFDPAVAGRDRGLAEDDELAGEAVGARDVVDLLASGGIKSLVDANDDMRRGDELAEAPASERRYFGERLALDQARRELAGDRDRDFDRFAFEPRFDRFQGARSSVPAMRRPVSMSASRCASA